MRARLNGAPAKATSGLMDMHDTTDADGVDDPERALLHRYVQGDAAAARLLQLRGPCDMARHEALHMAMP